ncbi:hypothetical protein WEI85_34925 [Actinomycetes bacterium KLBMP 9797]
MELSALLRSMPGLGTPDRVRADWFERKAALFERVAAEDKSSNGVEAAELAHQARQRAMELRGRRS